MSAVNNVNMTALMGNLMNAGTITSLTSNINLNAASTANMVLNSTNSGVWNAANGAINVRDALYNGYANVDILGGNYVSNALNIYTGGGASNVNVGQLTGILNSTGAMQHVLASTDVLTLGKICMTGDPTYYNSSGNISLTGPINVGEALTLIATGDITSLAAVG